MLKKILIITLSVLGLYWGATVLLSPSSSFIKVQYLSIKSKEHAIESNRLLPNFFKKICSDSFSCCDDFDLYVTNIVYSKHYGMLPIGYTILIENKVSLNIEYPNDISKYVKVKFEDYEPMNYYSNQSRAFNVGDTVDVRIFEDTVTLCQMKVVLEKD